MNKKSIAFKIMWCVIGLFIGMVVRVDIIFIDMAAINFVVAAVAFVISYILSSRQSLRWGFIGFAFANIIIAFGVV